MMIKLILGTVLYLICFTFIFCAQPQMHIAHAKHAEKDPRIITPSIILTKLRSFCTICGAPKILKLINENTSVEGRSLQATKALDVLIHEYRNLNENTICVISRYLIALGADWKAIPI